MAVRSKIDTLEDDIRDAKSGSNDAIETLKAIVVTAMRNSRDELIAIAEAILRREQLTQGEKSSGSDKASECQVECQRCAKVIRDFEPRVIRDGGGVICKLCWLETRDGNAKADPVNHPDHYNQGPMETIEIWVGMGVAEEGCIANIIKYLSRYKYKNPDRKIQLEDLRKAKWYMDWLVEHREKELEANVKES